MKYFWTFFWCFLLVQMLFYVISSMTGAVYSFKMASILSVPFTVLIYIISAVIPKKDS